METCVICNQPIEYSDTIAFMGYSTNSTDRTISEDTITFHPSCCNSTLIQILDEKLTY